MGEMQAAIVEAKSHAMVTPHDGDAIVVRGPYP
jgi:hypothetical protein